MNFKGESLLNQSNVSLENLFSNDEYQQFLDSTISNMGCRARLAKLFKKAKAGEDITIVSIGGSITSGAWATCEENKYATRVKNWFVKQFPAINVNFYNAGISATNSLIGVHRVDEQVLEFAPDLVTVDFTVNDSANDPLIPISYENLLRRLLQHKTSPAVLCIAFGSFAEDKPNVNAIDCHLPSITHYDLPFINYFGEISKQIVNGKFKWSDVAADTVHPNNSGHKIAADCICNYLNKTLSALETINDNYLIPTEFRFGDDSFMNAKLLKSDNFEPDCVEGFTPQSLHADKGDRIMGWHCDENGGKITFKVYNIKNVSVSIQKTAGNTTADVYINDKLVLKDADGNALSDSVVRFCHTEFFKQNTDAIITIIAKGTFGVGPLGVAF